jgi:hypothetical protein
MYFWIYLFAVPVALLALVLIYLLLRERSEFRRFSAWAAILTGFAAPAFALWGLTHRNAPRLPLAFDPVFDKKALALAACAALFGLAWILQSRRWYSILVFGLSFLAAAFWSTVVLPF